MQPSPREKASREVDSKLSALARAAGKMKPGWKKTKASTPVAESIHGSDKKSPPGSSDATALDLTDSFDDDFDEIEEEFDQTKYRHPRLCHNLGKAAVTPKERSQEDMDWVNQIVMKVNRAEAFLQGHSNFLLRRDSQAVHVDIATKMKQYIQGGPLREMTIALNTLKMNTDPNGSGVLRKDVRDGLIQVGSGLVLCGLFTALIGTGKGRRYDPRPPKPIELLDSVFGELKKENHRLCPCCRQERDACLKHEECTHFLPFSENERNNGAGVGEATEYFRTDPVDEDDSSDDEEFDFYQSI